VRKADNQPPSSADVMESGCLNLPEPSEPYRPVMGMLLLGAKSNYFPPSLVINILHSCMDNPSVGLFVYRQLRVHCAYFCQFVDFTNFHHYNLSQTCTRGEFCT
jgi:hypothetical protein